MELDVREALAFRVGPCPSEHLGRHVDADGFPRRADFLRGEEHVEPAAGAEVNDDLTRSKVGRCRRIAAGEAHVRLGGDA
jgi:hypothetical protein